MNRATKAIRFIEAVQRQGLSKKVAREIVELVDSREGELATKQDIEQLRQSGAKEMEQLRHSSAREIKQVRVAIKEAIRPIWAVMLTGFTIGFGLLLAVILHLHGATQAEMNQRFARIEAEMRETRQLILMMQAQEASKRAAKQAR